LKRSLFSAIALTIALVSAPSVSQAQLGLVKPFSIGVAGGAAQPMSDLKTGSNTGFNGTVLMAINLPLIPVGLRVDGSYNQFAAKASGDAKLHIMSATGNLVFKLPSVGVSPYLIGGAGMYIPAVTAPGAASVSENHFGWNAGAGINVPMGFLKGFLEARYNRVSVNGSSMEFVPVTLGIMF
jgi:Outer membrane protein beta-barrel domain